MGQNLRRERRGGNTAAPLTLGELDDQSAAITQTSHRIGNQSQTPTGCYWEHISEFNVCSSIEVALSKMDFNDLCGFKSTFLFTAGEVLHFHTGTIRSVLKPQEQLRAFRKDPCSGHTQW